VYGIRVELLHQAEDKSSVKLSLEIEVEEDLKAIAQVRRRSRKHYTYYTYMGYMDCCVVDLSWGLVHGLRWRRTSRDGLTNNPAVGMSPHLGYGLDPCTGMFVQPGLAYHL
jgi:hypothetical protein